MRQVSMMLMLIKYLVAKLVDNTTKLRFFTLFLVSLILVSCGNIEVSKSIQEKYYSTDAPLGIGIQFDESIFKVEDGADVFFMYFHNVLSEEYKDMLVEVQLDITVIEYMDANSNFIVYSEVYLGEEFITENYRCDFHVDECNSGESVKLHLGEIEFEKGKLIFSITYTEIRSNLVKGEVIYNEVTNTENIILYYKIENQNIYIYRFKDHIE